MQEQLSLRPAEFVKIRDGFIAFLKQPAGTPIEHVIPQAVIDTMVMAAQRGRKRRRMLDTACSASVLVAAIGAILAIVIDPMIIGIVILLSGGAAFIGAFNRRKIRSELEIDELITESNEALQRNLRALDDFRNVIANGDMSCEERLPDGSVKPVTAPTLRAFRADHGALLILSRDQAIWQCIPRRPIPLSALWVRLGGRVAPAFVTSRGLLDTSDRHLFDQRIEWLLSHADQSNHRASSFREAIQIIVALMTTDPLRRKALEIVAALDLPDCWIGAGFVRDALWDHLHGYDVSEPCGDVDVIWYDAASPQADVDDCIEQRLCGALPSLRWSVKNQARMHLRNGDAPYLSVSDAMRHWPETTTAVAVRLGYSGSVEVNAPLGLDDLFALRLRPTPHFFYDKLPIFIDRVASKRWIERYPKLLLEAPSIGLI